jgi:RNA polymerase sigma-70 factor (ECF subfamily)
MTDQANELTDLLHRAAQGEDAALTALFSQFRQRLKRMVRLRLNDRLRGRVDASDVVQEAYLEVSRRLAEYVKDPKTPFFLWLRFITGRKLLDVHRRHLGAQARDAGREISLDKEAYPAATSASLAAQLLGKLTSPSQAAIKAELQQRVQQALEALNPVDREVLALRHFEQLTNVEIAQLLGLSESGATARYLSALKRLKGVLSETPGLLDDHLLEFTNPRKAAAEDA